MSLSKNQLNLIKSLHQAEGRKETGMCLAEGAKLVNELLDLFPDNLHIYAVPEMVAQLRLPSTHTSLLTIIGAKEMARISALKNPPGILATLPLPEFDEDPGTSGKILWLDGVRDPGNLGTLLRTSEWFGYGEVWITSDGADPLSPKVIQAAMGSAFRMPVFRFSIEAVKEICLHKPRCIFGADLKGENCRKIVVNEPFALLIGNEGRGISPMAAKFVTRKITIPRESHHAFPESLNAASAAAVLMFCLG